MCATIFTSFLSLFHLQVGLQHGQDDGPSPWSSPAHPPQPNMRCLYKDSSKLFFLQFLLPNYDAPIC